MANQAQRDAFAPIRAAAGAAYIVKALAHVNAYLELAACDLAAQNNLMRPPITLAGFGGEAGTVPEHAEFQRGQPRAGLPALVYERHRVLATALGTQGASDTMVAARAAAGAAYATAAGELVAAWVELAACDMAASSERLENPLGPSFVPASALLKYIPLGTYFVSSELLYSRPHNWKIHTSANPAGTFNSAPDYNRLRHAVFLPNPAGEAALQAQVMTRFNQLVAGW
jgi:hypothetical protein